MLRSARSRNRRPFRTQTITLSLGAGVTGLPCPSRGATPHVGPPTWPLAARDPKAVPRPGKSRETWGNPPLAPERRGRALRVGSFRKSSARYPPNSVPAAATGSFGSPPAPPHPPATGPGRSAHAPGWGRRRPAPDSRKPPAWGALRAGAGPAAAGGPNRWPPRASPSGHPPPSASAGSRSTRVHAPWRAAVHRRGTTLPPPSPQIPAVPRIPRRPRLPRETWPGTAHASGDPLHGHRLPSTAAPGGTPGRAGLSGSGAAKVPANRPIQKAGWPPAPAAPAPAGPDRASAAVRRRGNSAEPAARPSAQAPESRLAAASPPPAPAW